MTAPPTIQTNPLDPVFSGVPVIFPQTGTVNPTWNKWFVDLREKVNVINQTLATLSGGSVDPSTGALAISSGGTGATTVAGAQTNLGILSNPMTAAGDIIIGGTGGTPTRLPGGSNTYVLTMVGGVPAWAAGGGGGGAIWLSSFVNTTSSTTFASANPNFRNAISSLGLLFAAAKGSVYGSPPSKIGIAFGSVTSSYVITSAYFGVATNNSASQPINFSGVPIQLTFGGATTVTVPGGYSIVLADPIDVSSISLNSPIVISVFSAGGPPNMLSYTTAIPGYSLYYKYSSTNESALTVTSGYSTSTNYIAGIYSLNLQI